MDERKTVHRIMTAEDGDLALEFAPTDKKAVKEAMERFNDLVKNKKMWAAAPGVDGKPGRLVRTFEPGTDLLFMPQLQGG
jgi:hypothetical protein